MAGLPVPARFDLLFVCTRGTCRSAFAEVLMLQLLADRCGPGAGIAVGSAGLRAVEGGPMHPDTRAALLPWGRVVHDRAGGFTARRFHPQMAERADLVLTAEVSHRVTVSWAVPRALPRTFTLRGFARILPALDPGRLPDDPVARAHAVVVAAGRARRSTPGLDEDVPDPAGAPLRRHLAVADLVFSCVAAFVDAVAPGAPVRRGTDV